MKLIAEIEGERRSIELRREGVRVVAETEGRRYEVEAREPEPGVYLLNVNGRVYECRVDSAAAGASEVLVGNRSYSITLSDPKRLRGAGASASDAGGRAVIKAPMPGKVVRVLVEVGAEVETGDGLVVVEAMKMQNEMKSPKTGTVVELHAQPGDTVNAGDALVIVE
ncbi:MAG TPA: biotin/lipoyl-containing protein [Pyrinomonadaceae bacterium]|jgi:biotin carboxyl carrier protein